MNRVAIIGVGNSKFGVRNDVTLPELSFESIKEALDDAEINQDDIDLSVIGSAGTRGYELMPASPINEYSGLSDKGPIRVEAACATGSAAIYTAYCSIASGQADVAISIGSEKMQEVDTNTSLAAGGRAGNYLWEFHIAGTTFPAYYGLYATQHMNKYGTKPEQLAKIAVKAHNNAALNSKAHFQKIITIEDVLESKIISSPLRLYDCCPMSDGSSTAILASETKIKELGIDTPIWIESMGYSSDRANITKRTDYLGLGATVRASKMAYNKAKIKPNEIDVATVHDCFTIAEIMAYEDLGFTKKGKGGEMIDNEETQIGGRIPINTDGGLKAKGHPLGATGISMIYELVKQLRGEADKRQVKLKNNIALAHNVGGTGHFCWVTVLKR